MKLANSQEQNIQQENIDENTTENVKTKSNDITRFISSSKKIAELSNADESLWIDLKDHKNLVLKYITRHTKKRGNILILHAQGESAVHKRLIHPLTKQLLTLGWNIFIPNIMNESFPIKDISKKIIDGIKPDEIESDNSKANNEIESAPTVNNYSFKDIKAYQSYFNNLCTSIFEQTKILELPLLIIANQNSAYWSIDCLKLANTITPVVFLQPEAPIGTTSNLKSIFAKQSVPFFSFVPANKSSPFSEMLKQGYWLSKSQKFNGRLVSNLKLDEQNYELAKSITGWVERQRKLAQ